MTLGIVIKGPSGLVLAADSRITLLAQPTGSPVAFPIHFDNASKLLRFGGAHSFVGAVTYGQAVVPGLNRTAESFLPELQAALPQNRTTVGEFAMHLSDFYLGQWGAAAQGYAGPAMFFLIGGFDVGAAYGSLFEFDLPNNPKPVEVYPNVFAARWGGDWDIVQRIWNGYRGGLPERLQQALGLSDAQKAQIQQVLQQDALHVPLDSMALQDSVNLAQTLIRTTIAMQQLSMTVRTVGGPIDIVTITRTDGVRPVRLKEISASEE